MADDKDEQKKNPRAEFLDAVTSWEREFDAAANKLMGTELYSQWMNQMQQGQLAMQKAYGEFMTQQLGAMNVPTREDVIRNGEALRRLEKRLENVERMLTELTQAKEKKPKKSKPKRTKKPADQDDS